MQTNKIPSIMESHLASSTPFPAAAAHLDQVAHIQNDSSPQLHHLHAHAAASAAIDASACSAPSSPVAADSSSPSFFLLHQSQSLPSQDQEQQEQQESSHERGGGGGGGGGGGDAVAAAEEDLDDEDAKEEAENENDEHARVDGKHGLVQQQMPEEEEQQQNLVVQEEEEEQYADEDLKQDEEDEEEEEEAEEIEEEGEQEAATIIDIIDPPELQQKQQQEEEGEGNDIMNADGVVNQIGNDMIMTREEEEEEEEENAHQGGNDMIIMTTKDNDDDEEEDHVHHQLLAENPPHHHHYDAAAAEAEAAAMDRHGVVFAAQLQLENHQLQHHHNHNQIHHMHCAPFQFPSFSSSSSSSSSSSDHHPSPAHLLCRINVNATINDHHHGAFAAGFCPSSTTSSSLLNVNVTAAAAADSFPALATSSSSPHHLIHIPSATRPPPAPIPTTSLDPPPSAVFTIPHHAHNQQLQESFLDAAKLTLLSDHGAASPHPSSDFVTHVAMDSPAAASPADLFKRKRGRPRKPPLDVSASSGFISAATSSLSKKRGVKKARMMNAAAVAAAGSSAASQAFKAHVIDIAAGEDLLVKIMSFMELEENLQGMCILSANGAISNVALTSAGGAMVTYEGRFEILSLSGSFLPAAEHPGTGIYDRRSGRGAGLRMNVSLGGANGHIVGGEVAGIFVAASPVKVVVATFLSSEIGRDSQIHEENQWSIQPIVEAAAAAAARESAFCNLSHMGMVHGQSQSSSGAAHGLQSPQGGGSDHEQLQLQPYHFPNTMAAAPPQTSTLGNWGLNQIDTRT